MLKDGVTSQDVYLSNALTNEVACASRQDLEVLLISLSSPLKYVNTYDFIYCALGVFQKRGEEEEK